MRFPPNTRVSPAHARREFLDAFTCASARARERGGREFFQPLRARHVRAYWCANPGFIDAFARVKVSENSFGQVCAHLARSAQVCASSREPWTFRRVSTVSAGFGSFDAFRRVSSRFATPRIVSSRWAKPHSVRFCPVVRNRGRWSFALFDAIPRSLTRAEVCEVWVCKVRGKPRSANQLNPPGFPPLWGGDFRGDFGSKYAAKYAVRSA